MRRTSIQLRISDLIFALLKRWKLIASLTMLGMVFGLLLSGMSYVQDSVQMYQISGSLSITTRNANGTFLGNNSVPTQNDVHLAEDMMDAVVYLVKSKRTLDTVISNLEMLGVVSSDIRSNMSTSQHNNTQIFTLNLVWPTAEEGLEIWQELVNVSNQLLPQLLMVGHLENVNEPNVTTISSGFSGKSTSMILAALGFMAGAGYAVMELLIHPTLTNVNDVETQFGLEILGMIPKDPEHFKKKTSILVQDDSSSAEVTQNYSSTAYILRNRLGTKEEHQVFYITSSVNREGRTTVAANLAIQLSDMEQRTLLIDFDTSNPTLGTLFLDNVDYSRSLNALYKGEITEVDAITTLTGFLDLLPMVLEHNPVSMDGMIEDLISKLSQKYDFVIIDAPPVGKDSTTLSLNQVANNVVFVVDYDNASIPEIQNALEKLDKSGIRVVGCVVNGVQMSNSLSLVGLKKVAQHDKVVKPKKKKRNPLKKKDALQLNSPPPDETVDELLKAGSGETQSEEETTPGTETAGKAKSGKEKPRREKARKEKPQKEKKPRQRQKAAEKNKQEEGFLQPQATTGGTFTHSRRNVMEDVMGDSGGSSGYSEEDMLDALLQRDKSHFANDFVVQDSLADGAGKPSPFQFLDEDNES